MINIKNNDVKIMMHKHILGFFWREIIMCKKKQNIRNNNVRNNDIQK